MRRKIIVLAALLFSVCANAQNAVGSWSIQPKVGINLATLTNDDDAKIRYRYWPISMWPKDLLSNSVYSQDSGSTTKSRSQ